MEFHLFVEKKKKKDFPDVVSFNVLPAVLIIFQDAQNLPFVATDR